MHVAQSLISLTFDSTEISGLESLSIDDSGVSGEAFDFAAVLQTNIGDGGEIGNLLPNAGIELPRGLVPDGSGVSAEAGQTTSTEIVASMNIVPSLVDASSVSVSDRASSVMATIAPKTPSSQPLPHTVKIEGLLVSNRVEPPLISPLATLAGQTGAEIVATMVPEFGAALRPNEMAGLRLANANVTASRGLAASASGSPSGAFDELPVLPDTLNNRLTAQPVTATMAVAAQAELDLNSRLTNQTTAQNFSSAASPSVLIQNPTAERPASPAFELTTTTIATPVRDVSWGDRISQQVLTMATAKTQIAEIRLTPAELGPLKVQIDVDDGLANVAFQSQHAATREAIELALPRLRELLAENGLTLGQADVGERQEAQREQGLSDQAKGDAQSRDDKELATDADGAVTTTSKAQHSLLDAFV